MSIRGIRPVAFSLIALAALFVHSGCTVKTSASRDSAHLIKVSVPDQKMALYHQGELVATYPVSTSKFGLGDERGSYKTPTGRMEVVKKIGGEAPLGAVFKSRKWTGEVLPPDAPGRDPIVSRILWLNGLERQNRNAYSRYIYIHGTAAESDIGTPASYGCIRMRSTDIADLYEKIGEGTTVYVMRRAIPDVEPVSAGSRATPVRLTPTDGGATSHPATPVGGLPSDTIFVREIPFDSASE